jgi:hypothetical protein
LAASVEQRWTKAALHVLPDFFGELCTATRRWAENGALETRKKMIEDH